MKYKKKKFPQIYRSQQLKSNYIINEYIYILAPSKIHINLQYHPI